MVPRLPTGEAVNMRPHKQTLLTYEWQRLRLSMEFTSVANARWSLEKLGFYLDHPNIDRVWRCLNLLAATTMGLNGQEAQGREVAEVKALVVEARETLSVLYAEMKREGQSLTPPTEEAQREELLRAAWEDVEGLVRLHRDLKKRNNPSEEVLAYRVKIVEAVVSVHGYGQLRE